MLTTVKLNGPKLQTENLNAANALVGFLSTNPGANHTTVCRFINRQKLCLQRRDLVNEVNGYRNYSNILDFLYANGQIVSVKLLKERKYFLSTQVIPADILKVVDRITK